MGNNQMNMYDVVNNDINKHELRFALTHLNNNYGKGEVTGINLINNTYWIVPFNCKPQKKKFRVKGRTVFACRHQFTIGARH